MFLKSEVFEYAGQTITLSELSAMQRIEHIQSLAKLEIPQSEDGGDARKLADALRVSIETGAQLVAMSLWHSDREKTVEQLQVQILESWPVEAIGAAATTVKKLSGMLPPESMDEPGEDHEENSGKESGPLTMEKSSPVN